MTKCFLPNPCHPNPPPQHLILLHSLSKSSKDHAQSIQGKEWGLKNSVRRVNLFIHANGHSVNRKDSQVPLHHYSASKYRMKTNITIMTRGSRGEDRMMSSHRAHAAFSTGCFRSLNALNSKIPAAVTGHLCRLFECAVYRCR